MGFCVWFVSLDFSSWVLFMSFCCVFVLPFSKFFGCYGFSFDGVRTFGVGDTPPLLAKEMSEKRAKVERNAAKNQSFFMIMPP
jgi:hypothetical protein